MVAGGTLPLICSDNYVRIVGFILFAVVLVPSLLLWGNILEAQGATALRRFCEPPGRGSKRARGQSADLACLGTGCVQRT